MTSRNTSVYADKGQFLSQQAAPEFFQNVNRKMTKSQNNIQF